MNANPRIALVHDWLTGMRGGEKVLEIFCDLYPEADIFTLIHVPGSVSHRIESHPIHTSLLQKLPNIKKYYRYMLPLMPKIMESFNLEGYDLVISTSHCVAKGCDVPQTTLHICYCFTPMRYIWDQFDTYFNQGQNSFITTFFMKCLRGPLQKWDITSSERVDTFIGISQFIKNRIKNCYNREATVIYPPADTSFYTPSPTASSDYFLVVSALVPYKRVDIAIEAFNGSGLPLKIVGTGPLEKKFKAMAKKNIDFIGWADDTSLRNFYQNCKALIFTSEEDFGIVPIEAMACGKPVIAFKKGGALETILENVTGLFFPEQTAQSLLNALNQWPQYQWEPSRIRHQALNFGKDIFLKKIKLFLNEKIV